MLGHSAAKDERKLIAHAVVMWGSAIRGMVGLPRLGALTFPVASIYPPEPCKRCGSLVAWVPLPTGGRMAVSLATFEVHDASCPAL